MNTKINIVRDYCVICESKKIKKIYKIENFPIYMGTLEKNERELFSDMEWGVCKKCGCVQLLTLIPPDILYKIPHNPAIGKTWESHNISFSDYIISNVHGKILDIGGANLKLANIISKNNNIKKYDIIDFSSEKYCVNKIDEKINIFKGSAESYFCNEPIDAIIMSHTFEHIYNPIELLKKIRCLLKHDGKICISIPNIQNQLRDGFLNALMFEHTFFINHYYIQKIFNRCGYKLENIYNFSKYNSFYCFKKNNNFKKKINFSKKPKKILNIFFKNLKKDINDVLDRINNEKIYIFGAHIFSQYMIKYGIKEEKIINILDNDTNKNNKKMYGTNIEVLNPNVLKDVIKPIILVRAGQYTDEICEQIKKINNEAIII